MAGVQTKETAKGRTTWNFDPAHTMVEFAVKHMMITTVKGRFAGVSGAIELDENDLARSSVAVEIDAASLDTRVGQRDAHLRSADFLDVENHPTLTFRSRRVEGSVKAPGDGFRLVGDLMIRGTTREVVLDARYEGRGMDPWGGERVSFSADVRIDRRDYGLTWNQAIEAGRVLVGNEVRIHIEVQAVKAGEDGEAA
ncbi:MAG TPA: YceI family protein [Longimicrobiales bacterium]